MSERTTGIILRTYALTESSLIAHWLTADQGRIATVAKGARRPKSPFRGKLDLYYEGELEVQRSRRSDLHTLREFRLTDTHQAIRRDLAYLTQAAYCGALLEQTSETDTPVPEMFRLFKDLLHHLPSQRPTAKTILAFELKVLAASGLMASQQADRLSASARQIVQSLERSAWPEIAAPALDRKLFEEVERFLHGFLMFHLGKYPRNRAEALGHTL